MLTAYFENAYFLQALGWAVANSLWQVGLLCLLYKIITGLKLNSSAVFKHNLSFTLLMVSTVWFVFTIIQSYQQFKNSTITSFSFLIDQSALVAFNLTLPYFAILYVLFLFFYLARFSSSLFKTIHLKRTDLIKPDVDVRIFVSNTVLHLDIKKKVQVWFSQHVDVPSVIGFIKPVILLPAAAIAQLNTQQIEAILLHELAHIKRHDFLLNLLQTFAKIILFFNPFATLLNKQIESERENCCDDWVLNYQYNKETYANALLQIETYRQKKILLALAATNGKKQLLNRIKRLFTAEPSTILSGFQKIQIAGICLGLGITILLMTPINTSVDKTTFAKTNTVSIIKKPVILANNIPSKTTTSTRSKPNSNIKNTTILKKQVIKNKDEYSFTLINEDLLQGELPLNYNITTVSDKDPIVTPKYFVKIEDQQSGNKNNSVYYFEVSKDSGKTALKPLIFLNKPVKKAPAKKLPDTSDMPGKKVTT